MKNLPFSLIVQQLKADLIGKDSYRGITLTYAWLANQFGHFALGFIPSFFLYKVLLLFFPHVQPIHAAIIVSCGWFLFECYNFLGPLLLKNKLLHQGRYIFEPDWLNIAYDTITDVVFFVFGAFTFSLSIDFSMPLFLLVLGIIILLVYPMYYWYQTKIYLQESGFPYQFRLSQWKGGISLEHKQIILDFLSNSKPNHLIIFGPELSGKSALAVGVATELAIKNQCVCYHSAIKWLSIIYGDLDRTNEWWNWKNTKLVVIDDLNPGNPIEEEVLSLAKMADLIKRAPKYEEILEYWKTERVIWVLGNEINSLKDWKTQLVELGVPQNQILSLEIAR